MRRVICWLRGHNEVSVAIGGAGLFVLPTVGLVCEYEPNENGDYLACTRCRRVRPGTEFKDAGGSETAASTGRDDNITCG